MWQMLTYGLYYYHGWTCQFFDINEFTFARPVIKTTIGERYKDIKRVPYEKRKKQSRSYAQKYRDNNKEKINEKLRIKRSPK